MQITRTVAYGQLTRGDEFLIDGELRTVISTFLEAGTVALWVRDENGSYHTQEQIVTDKATVPVYGE